MKPIIVHSHIYKCAGTSIISSLKKCFNDDLVLTERDTDKSHFLNGESIKRILDKNESVAAISSHTITCALPKLIRGRKVIPITLLRDPLSRAKSVYFFNKKLANPHNMLQGFSASCDSFEEWMLCMLNSQFYSSLIDYQIRFFLDKVNPGDNIKESHLQDSVNILKSDQMMVGTVERIDESLALWEYKLRKYFPSLDLSIAHENSTKNTRLASNSLDELSEKTLNKFTRNNKDFFLWKLASDRLDEELSKIEGFHAYLNDYKRRCKESKIDSKTRKKTATSSGNPCKLPLDRCLGDSSLNCDISRSSSKFLDMSIRDRKDFNTVYFKSKDLIHINFSIQTKYKVDHIAPFLEISNIDGSDNSYYLQTLDCKWSIVDISDSEYVVSVMVDASIPRVRGFARLDIIVAGLFSAVPIELVNLRAAAWLFIEDRFSYLFESKDKTVGSSKFFQISGSSDGSESYSARHLMP
jgi:hypothetical protein